MNCSGLAVSWEGSESVRVQIRQHKALCVHPASERWCEPNRMNCNNNSSVLIPALEILRDTPDWKLPHLEPLQVEVALVYEKVGVPVDARQVYTSAVELKKMIGFIKRRVKRREVTKAIRSKQAPISIIQKRIVHINMPTNTICDQCPAAMTDSFFGFIS
eukprot:Skav222204  [mRNA]  locus=scaffold3943:27407:27886:+ [translate_table: standard]